MAESKFVLSPPGFGEDCYRTWEAVLLGAVPIVRRSPLQQLYDGAPVVVVDVREFFPFIYLVVIVIRKLYHSGPGKFS